MEIDYYIERLEEALEKQKEDDGRGTPTVEYCFECDEIVLDRSDDWEHHEHETVYSDGYEHHGIGAALTVLKFIRDNE